jgi:DNA-binding MarR family transcriptional regulator
MVAILINKERDFKLLRFLVKQNGARFNEIAEQGFMSRGVLSKHLQDFIDKDLVDLKVDKSTRKPIYIITKEGVKAVEEYFKKHGYVNLKDAF